MIKIVELRATPVIYVCLIQKRHIVLEMVLIVNSSTMTDALSRNIEFYIHSMQNISLQLFIYIVAQEIILKFHLVSFACKQF